MPAVVRGGRRQGSKSASPRSGRGGPSHFAAVPGKAAAIGRLDLTPRVVGGLLIASVAVLGVVLATGARAERIGASFDRTVENVTVGMGLGLKRVHVTGASPEARPAVQHALALRQGQSIATLDLDALRRQVEAVGWVRSARVVRLLPDTLIVDVVEHDRLAVWQMAGQAHVIDASGEVIQGADAGRHPELPLIVGKGADQAATEILPLLAQRPRLMSRVDALVRVDERRWDLRLKDGGLVQLPALDQEAALIRLDALDQRERLLDLGFARVDLRTPETVAVRPTEGAA